MPVPADCVLDQPGIMFTDLIRINARLFHSKPAVVCGDQRLSWTDFHRRTNQVAHALLAMGLTKGTKVALAMDSSVAMFELIWGTVKAGGVIVPLNIMMAQQSLGLMIDNSDAKFVFADPKVTAAIDAVRPSLGKVAEDGFFIVSGTAAQWRSPEALIDAAAETEPDVELDMYDSMNIIYSSGSTGVPKGIEHSHMARHIYSLGFGPGLKMDRHSVAVCSTPLYTNGTWITMLPAVYFGGTTVLMPSFSPQKFLETVQRERGSHLFMVPTQYIAIVESGLAGQYDTSSLRSMMSGGQAIAGKTFELLQEQFPTAGIYQCYGITEGFSTLATPEDHKRGKIKSVGLPLFGGEIVILDDSGNVLPPGEIGDITGYGPALMRGYYNNPAATRAMIWRDPMGRSFIRSGDLGSMDEDGYIYVSGRIKDMIKSGGINIYASDIEDVFMQHPDMVEVAAIGIPHPKWMETPLLLAIRREGATVSETELMEWGNARLGKWQRVSRVEFRTEFPRATHDKVLKRALRDPYWPKPDSA